MQTELQQLNKKRLAFVDCSQKNGMVPARALYAQHEGGFMGIGISEKAGSLLLISGPGPMNANDDYWIVEAPPGRLHIEVFFTESEGFGGLFGFGKKGGTGYKFHHENSNGSHTLVIRPNVTNIADVLHKDDMVFLRGKANAYNPVWDMHPETLHTCKEILSKWCGFLGVEYDLY